MIPLLGFTLVPELNPIRALTLSHTFPAPDISHLSSIPACDSLIAIPFRSRSADFAVDLKAGMCRGRPPPKLIPADFVTFAAREQGVAIPSLGRRGSPGGDGQHTQHQEHVGERQRVQLARKQRQRL